MYKFVFLCSSMYNMCLICANAIWCVETCTFSFTEVKPKYPFWDVYHDSMVYLDCWCPSKISPDFVLCTLCIHEHLMHSHWRLSLRYIWQQQNEVTNQNALNISWEPAAFRARSYLLAAGKAATLSLLELLLRCTVADHNWYSKKVSRGSIQYFLLLLFCRLSS